MGLTFADRVLETTITNGTGTLTLNGSLTGYQSFGVVGNGNTCYFCIYSVDPVGNPTGPWETNLGTYTSSGTTLSRTNPPLASSNSGSLVNFTSGTKRVVLIMPATYVGQATQLNITTNNSFGIQQVKADGVTLAPLLYLDANNNLHIDPHQVTTLAGMGPSAGGHGGAPWWIHNMGGLSLESYDYQADMIPFNTDPNNNVLLGTTLANDQLGDVYLSVPTGQAVRVQLNKATVGLWDSAGRLRLQAGGSSGLGSVPASPGGSLFDHYATVSTLHTDGTEDTLYTDTIAANVFQTVGDKITFRYAGSFVGSASATRRLQITLAGSVIFDTTALVSSSTSYWVIDGTLIYSSVSGVVRYSITISAPGLASVVPPSVSLQGGLSVNASMVLALTGAAASSGAASGDVVATMGAVNWIPAAVAYVSPLVYAPLTWWDAAGNNTYFLNRVSLCTNGQLANVILDKSGNGLNLWYSGTSGGSATFQTNIQNSLPMLLFNGTNGEMFCQPTPYALNVLSQIAEPFSVYMVFKIVSWSSGNVWPFSPAPGTGIYFNGTNLNLYAGGNVGGPAASTGTVYTVEGIFNGASSAISINGGTQSTGSDGGTTMYSIHVGSASNSQFCNMYMGECLIFPYVVSGATRTAVLSYLRTKWAHY